MKPKVMILHNIISPYRNPLFEELSKKYDLEVYFCKSKAKDRKWATNLKNYSFKYKILSHIDFGPLVINPSIKKELSKKVYDIYIIVENPENALSILKTMKFSRKKGKKIIIWNERTDDLIISLKRLKKSLNPLNKLIYSIINTSYKSYRKKIYLKAISFIAFSKKAKVFLKSEGIDPKNIFTTLQIMPESILEKSGIKKKPKVLENKKIIFNLGYLNERKGVDVLIKAFNKLNRKDTVLLIAGTGEEEFKLKKLAQTNKNIKFIGYIDGAKKANYYSISDFFVLPTNYDCWGLVVNEAFYYGLPIISTNKAGATEIIENKKTGFIIPSGDVNILANAMKRLLDQTKLLNQMKKNVKKIPKSKIVDIRSSIKPFEKAINALI